MEGMLRPYTEQVLRPAGHIDDEQLVGKVDLRLLTEELDRVGGTDLGRGGAGEGGLEGKGLVAPGHFLPSASGVLGAAAVSWAALCRCPALATWVTPVV